MDVISDYSPQPGGRKNVELLNSVSRANYTMLTFRRSVRPAEDAFDVPVLLDRPQNIFWEGSIQCYILIHLTWLPKFQSSMLFEFQYHQRNIMFNHLGLLYLDAWMFHLSFDHGMSIAKSKLKCEGFLRL